MIIIFSSHDSEATKDVNSFEDFEKMWAQIGEDLEVQAYSKR